MSDDENADKGCCDKPSCEKSPAEKKSEEKQSEISKKEAALWLNLSAARLNQDKRSEAAQAAQHAIDIDLSNPKGNFIKSTKISYLSLNFSLLSTGQGAQCFERL